MSGSESQEFYLHGHDDEPPCCHQSFVSASMCLLAIALREYVSPTGESAWDAAVISKTRTDFHAGALEYL